MEPEFHDGDKVFVKEQNTVEEGEIGIFIINGDAYIKKTRQELFDLFEFEV